VSQFLVLEIMGSESFFMTISASLWPRLLPLLQPMTFEAHERVCMQGEDCDEMHVVISGILTGSSFVDGATEPAVHRTMTKGDSVNVLCMLEIWYKVTLLAIIFILVVVAANYLTFWCFVNFLVGSAWRPCRAVSTQWRHTQSRYSYPAVQSIHPNQLFMHCFPTTNSSLKSFRNFSRQKSTPKTFQTFKCERLESSSFPPIPKLRPNSESHCKFPSLLPERPP